jgi:hypothetical protein
MPVNFSVTDEGPPTFTEPQVRAANVDDWREKFGDDADTSREATDGQLIDLSTLPQLLLWQAAVRLWADSFVRTATGAALDNILAAFGKTRNPASSSTGTAVFFGSESTPVPASTEIQTTGSANRFATTALGTTGALLGSDVWMVRIPATVVAGSTYDIDIDATPHTYLAAGGDDADTVANELRDAVNAGADGTATRAGIDAGGRALVIIDVTGGPGVVVASDDDGGGPTPDPEEFPAVRIAVEALSTGPLTAPAGTLQSIPTPVAGITGASNGADATAGADEETDDEFRERHLSSLFGPGCGTEQAIEARVLATTDAAGIEFVETATVTSNRNGPDPDAEGRPKGSFETVTRYRDGAPADADARVALSIAECMPAGVEPYGVTWTETVEVRPGKFVDVSGTIVTALFLHLGVTVTKGEGWPAGLSDAQAKTAIAEAISTDWNAIRVEAKDWYRTTVNGSVNRVVNDAAADISTLSDTTPAPGDVPALVSVAVQVANAREIIEADASRIAVTIV